MDDYNKEYGKGVNAIFTKNLKRLMSKYRLQNVDLAKNMGVSAQTVSAWVNGHKMPRMKMLDKLCAVLHCSRIDLLEDSEETRITAKPFTESDVKEYMAFLESMTPTADQARRDYEEALIQDIKNNVEKLSKTNLETLSRFCNFLISEQNEEKR